MKNTCDEDDRDGWSEIARGLSGIASALREIAGAGTADPRGHIEFLAGEVSEAIRSAGNDIADALRQGFEALAAAHPETRRPAKRTGEGIDVGNDVLPDAEALLRAKEEALRGKQQFS